MRSNESSSVQNPRVAAKKSNIHPDSLKPTKLKRGQTYLKKKRTYGKNLSYHFVGAGRKDELRKLLLDFKGYSPNGSPLISTLESHLSGVNAVSFTPDRKYLVSTSDINTLKVWDPKTGKEVHTLRGHLRGILQPVA